MFGTKVKELHMCTRAKGGEGVGGDDDATTPSGGSPDIWADSKSKLRGRRRGNVRWTSSVMD